MQTLKRRKGTWEGYLPYNVYVRLVECRTVKTDIPILLDARWKWAQDTGHCNGYTKADFLADILNSLDDNGLEKVTRLTMEEWHNLVG